MTKSEFFIQVLAYARKDKAIAQEFNKRDNDDRVTLRKISIKHDRSESEIAVFRIGVDYVILKEGFSVKEDLLIEVFWNRKTKDFTKTRFVSADEVDV